MLDAYLAQMSHYGGLNIDLFDLTLILWGLGGSVGRASDLNLEGPGFDSPPHPPPPPWTHRSLCPWARHFIVITSPH